MTELLEYHNNKDNNKDNNDNNDIITEEGCTTATATTTIKVDVFNHIYIIYNIVSDSTSDYGIFNFVSIGSVSNLES